MKIIEFNLQKGIYSFELGAIKTDFHTHPAVEILFSRNGGIEVETAGGIFKNICFAVINRNIEHRVVTKKGNNSIIMIECAADYFEDLLDKYNIHLTDGIYVETKMNHAKKLINEVSVLYHDKAVLTSRDSNVQECLTYLNSDSSDYKKMIGVLKSRTNLSESRLSHLFKAQIGISIKKYLVWSRLKRAFKLVVDKDVNMYEAALQSGFYDQAHLSNAFKKLMGMNPSEVYNSRIVQE